jgi:hypothetical protein
MRINMKKLVLQNMITTTALLAATSYASTVLAHSAPGSLGTVAGAVDVWQTACVKDTVGATGRFVTTVKATKIGTLVSIQTVKGKLASNATDAKSGDAAPSPNAILTGGGEGVYTILVNKNGAGAMNYVFTAHCQTTAGKETKQTEPVPVQNK